MPWLEFLLWADSGHEFGDRASVQAATRVNAEQTSKRTMCAGRNAQQAAVGVEELLFRGHRDVVDADLADYFGSIPHSDLLD